MKQLYRVLKILLWCVIGVFLSLIHISPRCPGSRLLSNVGLSPVSRSPRSFS